MQYHRGGGDHPKHMGKAGSTRLANVLCASAAPPPPRHSLRPLPPTCVSARARLCRAIKFAAYESMRQVHRKVYKGRPATVQEDFAMGAVAGAAAAAATTPLDVIKTNMMCSAALRPTMFTAASAVYVNGGAPAFFRGIGARALSNGINSAVFFCFFEALRGMILKHKLSQEALQLQQ